MNEIAWYVFVQEDSTSRRYKFALLTSKLSVTSIKLKQVFKIWQYGPTGHLKKNGSEQ